MKSRGVVKKAKSMSVKDENPALRKVVAGVKKVVKKLAPGTKETVNAWGCRHLWPGNPFAFYRAGKKHFRFSVCDIAAGSEGIAGGYRKKHEACEIAERGGLGEEGTAGVDRCCIALRGWSSDAGHGCEEGEE